MSKFSFPKSERLTNKKKFEKLFTEGRLLKSYPLKLIYSTESKAEDVPPIQFAFTVPKRNFKKAVERNLLKRRMKEAYRLNKPDILDYTNEKMMNVYGIIIFTGREEMAFADIQKSWKKIAERLTHEIVSQSS